MWRLDLHIEEAIVTSALNGNHQRRVAEKGQKAARPRTPPQERAKEDAPRASNPLDWTYKGTKGKALTYINMCEHVKYANNL